MKAEPQPEANVVIFIQKYPKALFLKSGSNIVAGSNSVPSNGSSTSNRLIQLEWREMKKQISGLREMEDFLTDERIRSDPSQLLGRSVEKLPT